MTYSSEVPQRLLDRVGIFSAFVQKQLQSIDPSFEFYIEDERYDAEKQSLSCNVYCHHLGKPLFFEGALREILETRLELFGIKRNNPAFSTFNIDTALFDSFDIEDIKNIPNSKDVEFMGAYEDKLAHEIARKLHSGWLLDGVPQDSRASVLLRILYKTNIGSHLEKIHERTLAEGREGGGRGC